MDYKPNLSPEEFRFFEVVGPWMDRFARRHDLELEKWSKDVGMWAVHFRHPLKGIATLMVEACDPGGAAEKAGPPEAVIAMLQSNWSRDDYDTETRWSMGRRPRSVPWFDEIVFLEALTTELRQVLDWTANDLEPHPMQTRMWHKYLTKERFADYESSLPEARL
jgi:hypothetical protein